MLRTKVLFMVLLTIAVSAMCMAMDRPPKDFPTAIVVDDETGKPIEGAVAIAIWRGDKEDCTLVQGLEGGCWGFKKAEEAFSDKEGIINIQNFWKTTKGPGKWGSAYDPRLTVYKYGYVCWDQKDIFAPNYQWPDRKDFDKNHRIIRMKKWQDNFSNRGTLKFYKRRYIG